MEENKSLATVQEKGLSAFGGGIAQFEDAQRMAKALAESSIVPKDYQNKLSNCLVALEVAQRTGSSVLAVMQNMYIVHGKPSWSAQYIIGVINSSGRYTPLRFAREVRGKVKTKAGKEIDNITCKATATDKSTGEVLVGPEISMEMAIGEGWYDKDGSKWKTLPELMVQYRSATFFGRLYCPELLLGMSSDEEMRDVGPAVTTSSAPKDVNEKIRQRKAKAEAIEVEARPVTQETCPVDIILTNDEKKEFF